jgi:predicted phosphoribosyltransferase
MILIKEYIMKNKSKIVSINLNEKDYKKLRSQAFKNEVSLSFFIRQKLGLEENKNEVIEEVGDDVFTSSMRKGIEDSNKREEERLKKIEEEQLRELEKEQADFFNSSNSFENL